MIRSQSRRRYSRERAGHENSGAQLTVNLTVRQDLFSQIIFTNLTGCPKFYIVRLVSRFVLAISETQAAFLLPRACRRSCRVANEQIRGDGHLVRHDALRNSLEPRGPEIGRSLPTLASAWRGSADKVMRIRCFSSFRVPMVFVAYHRNV